MENIIIIVIIAVVVLLAIKPTVDHFKGKGACCGGGSLVPEHKTLDGPIIDKRVFHVEGMTCDNCKIRVERAINSIDGVAAKVNLKKKTVTVEYCILVEDDVIIAAIEKAGYNCTI